MVGTTASALLGVMNPLLAKLSTLLEREYAKLKGVRREVELLQGELSSMNTALEAVSRVEEPGAQVKEWMRQLRELSYDVEDCVDLFAHRLGQPDPGDGLIRRTARQLKALRARHCVAAQIAHLKERAVVVNDRRKRYDLDASAGSTAAAAASIDSRLPALFEAMDRLVGIAGPRDELVEWLTGGDGDGSGLDRRRRVVSIVGFGGLGKTTLANQVYQHIRSQFDCTAFVSVSRNPNINKILTDILIGVLETTKPATVDQKTIQDLKQRTFEDSKLVSMIRENLQKSRYCIVIDDIWSKSAWHDVLRFIFPENESASRIITTSRIRDVAKACSFSPEDYVYIMKPLSSENSKTLFLHRIFGPNEKCSPELEEVADLILKKCDGLPLAIVNIASLLSSKPVTKQEWVLVLNSIGSTLHQDQESHELAVVKRILFLSYCDLPHHLKICLLYLGVFPEDYPITREFLISRWIAEGFITEQRGQSLEQVGEKYFNELINRNMIQPFFDLNYDSTQEAYRVHDIMLDLIISLSTEENFATIVDSQCSAPSSNKIRRFSLQCTSKENITWLTNTSFSHARSLNVFGDFKNIPRLVDLQVLRVLDLMYCSSLKNEHLEKIGSLIQLRYLRLGSISEIPKQIGKLQLLQTLDLRGTAVKQLPESTVQLVKLVRLFLPWQVKLPNGIGNMEALQVLSVFDGTTNSPAIIQELGNLTRLKDLDVYWDYDDTEGDEIYNDHLVMSLCKLGGYNLRSLRIEHVYRSSVDFLVDSWYPSPRHLQTFKIDIGCYFSSLPKWITSSLSQLTCLIIRINKVGEEDLQVLESLLALNHLDLYLGESPKRTLAVRCSGFSSLREFSYGPTSWDVALLMTDRIDHKYGLGMGLMFEAGAMPKLQRLEFGISAHDILSEYGVGLDFGIQHITSIRHLRVLVYCRDASAWEIEAAEAAITNSVSLIRSSPVLEICRIKERANDEQKKEAGVIDLQHDKGIKDGTNQNISSHS